MAVIDNERLAELEKAERKLHALEPGGVVNWDGYDFSMEEIRREAFREEKAEAIADQIQEIIADGIDELAGRGCGYGLSTSAQAALVKYIATLPINFDDLK